MSTYYPPSLTTVPHLGTSSFVLALVCKAFTPPSLSSFKPLSSTAQNLRPSIAFVSGLAIPCLKSFSHINSYSLRTVFGVIDAASTAANP